MQHWNHMQIEIAAADRLLRPVIGPGGLTREEAHSEVQALLDRDPQLVAMARTWRQGAKNDTVYFGPMIWTIYPHNPGDDPRHAALEWLEDFAATMRTTGLDVQVAKLP